VPISPLPYRPRPLGDEPDPARPLRREPVRRDEVRIYLRLGEPRITMPVGTYRLEERGKYHTGYFVGDPALWQSLIEELATQHSPRDEDWQRMALPVSGPARLPKPEISWGLEYICEQCGARFLAHKLAGNMVRLCSDKCARERGVSQERQWRETAPPGPYRRNRSQQRAAVRADRTCEQCGVAIKAARSTRRFCSRRCRIRAYHQRRSEAADG
jgi:hypothetical protein